MRVGEGNSVSVLVSLKISTLSFQFDSCSLYEKLGLYKTWKTFYSTSRLRFFVLFLVLAKFNETKLAPLNVFLIKTTTVSETENRLYQIILLP